MRTRRSRRGDVHPVTEQDLCHGLQFSDVEVGTAFLHGNYQLGGIRTQLATGVPDAVVIYNGGLSILAREIPADHNILCTSAATNHTMSWPPRPDG